jgi:hypothetical protein
MGARAPHGAGAAVDAVGYRIETKPWDEQPTPQAGEAAPLRTDRDTAGRVRTTAAARAMAKLPRRRAFVPRKLATDPRFDPHNRRRLEYLRRRRAEVATAWGGLSHGVAAMLAAEAWQWAAAEYANELGAETGDADHFKTGATLAAQAKQQAAAAWELSARESAARREAAPPVDPLAGFYRVAEGSPQ